MLLIGCGLIKLSLELLLIVLVVCLSVVLKLSSELGFLHLPLSFKSLVLLLLGMELSLIVVHELMISHLVKQNITVLVEEILLVRVGHPICKETQATCQTKRLDEWIRMVSASNVHKIEHHSKRHGGCKSNA